MREALIYEDRPEYDFWMKTILFSPLITLGLGIWFLYVDIAGAIVMFAITVFDSLLFRLIMPRAYRIYTDRLIIRLGGPFAKTVMLSDIKRIRKITPGSVMSSGGIKFTTRMQNNLEIERYKGMIVLISPRNPDMFLEQLEQAKKVLG